MPLAPPRARSRHSACQYGEERLSGLVDISVSGAHEIDIALDFYSASFSCRYCAANGAAPEMAFMASAPRVSFCRSTIPLIMPQLSPL